MENRTSTFIKKSAWLHTKFKHTSKGKTDIYPHTYKPIHIHPYTHSPMCLETNANTFTHINTHLYLYVYTTANKVRQQNI